MNPAQRELYDRITVFEIDLGPVALPFAARLARENGWTAAYAERVVREYKRFVFLAVAAGHPVTPSDQVDQAWHLHLVYTRSYWDGLCRGVLGRPLHHGPTAGGAAEAAKFSSWYARTLESYQRLFDEAPPADVWPSPEVRLSGRHRFVRIDASRHWIVPSQSPARAGLAGAAAAGLAVLVGCEAAAAGRVDPIAAVVLGAVVLLTLFIVLVFALSRASRGGRRGGDGGCGGLFGWGGDGDGGDSGGDGGCGGGGCGGGGD